MTIRAPFQPKRGANHVATVTNSSVSTAIDAAAKSVRLVNTGADIAYVRIGVAPQTALSGLDMPVVAGTELVVSKGMGEDVIAYISPTTTTLHIQTGEGGV